MKRIKKGMFLGVIMGMACVLMIGCHIRHEWQEATCSEPRTCLTGGETEGEALGHTWVEATCEEPKTCSVCGETEGEPLGHTWTEAACTEARTCSVCGATEGEPLGHDWKEANYQEPKTCSVCGETEGEPLTPAFVEHGLVADMEQDVTYDYNTSCYLDTAKKTLGRLTVCDYEVFDSDETHEAKEGYEWRGVSIFIVFNANEDSNLANYGAKVGYIATDYYTPNSTSWTFDSSDTFTVDYFGEKYECKADTRGAFGDWEDHVVTYVSVAYFQVPVGYDGIVLEFVDAINAEEELNPFDVIDENTHIFRLD